MNMKRHEARELFEQLVTLRERYSRLGSDDRASLMSVDAAVAYAELLAADLSAGDATVAPAEATSEDDYANQTGY